MKRTVWLLAALLAAFLLGRGLRPPEDAGEAVTRPSAQASAGSVRRIRDAFENRRSDVPVESAGRVLKVLADDRDGSRHQRFLLELPGGPTLLVAHNIDLAPRITGLQAGDTVAFKGEYVWTAKGGVLHWTHRDPDGRHPGGWLEHRGRIYQ